MLWRKQSRPSLAWFSCGLVMFDILFGAVYGLLGIAGFVAGSPGTSSMALMPADDRLLSVIPGVLELGTSDHSLHILLGLVFLVAGLMTKATADRSN